jgi:transcriptional regulator with XRE-family HTH domain
MAGFAERLRRLRESRGLSKREMASLLGVDPMQISRYELERTLPSAETIVRIAQLFQISTDEVLSGSSTPQEPPVIKDPRLFERFRQLDGMPKREREVVLEVIDAVIARRRVEDAVQRPRPRGSTATR